MFGDLIIWDLFLPLMGIHILVVVDYVTKWVEPIPTSSADHNTSIKMLKEVIFPRFGVPCRLNLYTFCSDETLRTVYVASSC